MTSQLLPRLLNRSREEEEKKQPNDRSKRVVGLRRLAAAAASGSDRIGSEREEESLPAAYKESIESRTEPVGLESVESPTERFSSVLRTTYFIVHA